MSDSPAAGNPASGITPDAAAVRAAAKVLEEWMTCDCLDGEYEAVMHHALKAAEPLMAADLERAVQRAEVLVAERDRQWAEALRENERLLRKLEALEGDSDE